MEIERYSLKLGVPRSSAKRMDGIFKGKSHIAHMEGKRLPKVFKIKIREGK